MVKDNIIKFFSNFQDIDLIILFGSYASGKSHAKSDIDIAILKQAKIPKETLMDLTQNLSTFLELEVDLLDLSTCHGAILSEIISNGEILYCSNYDKYEVLLKKMWYEKEDDGRFLAKIVKERLKYVASKFNSNK